MCTSNASKPARVNAAAISTWPLTPWSRRIATFGRTPVFDDTAAAISSAGSKPQLRRDARRRRRRNASAYSALRALADCRGALHRAGWFPTTPPSDSRHGQRAIDSPPSHSFTRLRVCGAPQKCASLSSPCCAEHGEKRSAIAGADLHHGAEFLGEQRRQRRFAPAVQFQIEAAVSGERHLDQASTMAPPSERS